MPALRIRQKRYGNGFLQHTMCSSWCIYHKSCKSSTRQVDKEIVTTSPYVQAVVVNSGIANACTGAEGLGYCADTAAEAAAALKHS